MKNIEIKVEGMMCSGCENRVKNALENIHGVQKVVADHKNKKVEVICSDKVTENIIKEKIEVLGFEIIRRKENL